MTDPQERDELLRVATAIYSSMVSSSVGGVDDLEVALPEASWAVEVAEGLIDAVNNACKPVASCCGGSCEEGCGEEAAFTDEQGTRPLKIADFEALDQGAQVTLYYDHGNGGEFVWVHDRVEGGRVWGQFSYADDPLSEVRDYLYEFQGSVCRGSGAEPVWSVEPSSTEEKNV